MPEWTALLVDQTGTAGIPTAWSGNITNVEFVYGGHGGCHLSQRIGLQSSTIWTDYVRGDNYLADLANHEVQVYRDTDLVGWFTPTRIDVQNDTVEIDCSGLSWYFERLTVGRSTQPANALTNPSFESTLSTEWEAVGCTRTRDTSKHFLATASLRIDGTTGTYPDAFVTQSVASPPNGVGVLWTASAWVWIDGTAWTGPALNGRGLYLEWLDTGGSPTVQDLNYQSEAMAYLPRDQWVRLTTSIHVPPDTDATVRLRLYGGQEDSILYWDDVQLVQPESATFVETAPEDIIEYLVDLAQDPAVNKADLDIVTTQSVDRTGYAATVVNRSYQYAEHINTWQAVQELIESDPDQILGVRMVNTVDTRTFLIEFPSHASASFASPVYTLRYGPDASGNARDQDIASWSASVDFTQGANQIIVVSDVGTGDNREEAFIAADEARVYEEVIPAPPGSTIDTLGSYASKQWVYRNRPLTVTVNCVPSGGVDLVAELIAGDFVAGDYVTLDLRADDGIEVLNGVFSATSISIDPATEVVTLKLSKYI